VRRQLAHSPMSGVTCSFRITEPDASLGTAQTRLTREVTVAPRTRELSGSRRRASAYTSLRAAALSMGSEASDVERERAPSPGPSSWHPIPELRAAMAGAWQKLESWDHASDLATGSWYLLDEPVVICDDTGRAFATKPDRIARRPVVLRIDDPGPAAPVWPRSGSEGWGSEESTRGVAHAAHPRTGDHLACPIREPGRVCTHVPCTVTTRRLEGEWRCREPEGTGLWPLLEGRETG
jgi:hypothetical protein